MANEDDEDPSTPKRKASNPIAINRQNGRAVRSPRTPGTGIRKTSGGQKNTPRKASAHTPNSAPARNRAGVLKPRNEPTLLGDFLLGRPSPSRKTQARRKSLDAVKAEMRVNNISQVRPPGKVQERVKQWQKNNAKAGPMVRERNLEEIVVEYETESEVEVTPMRRSTPNARARERSPESIRDEDVENRNTSTSPRPGRRKGRDDTAKGKEPEPRSKSVAPKKRVISDEHWMKNRRRSPPSKGNAIPKNFLQATAVNPPVERKIEDWVKRMAAPEPPERVETPKRKVRRADSEESEEKPRSRKVSRRTPVGDGIRVRCSSRASSPDDEIRIKPSKDRPSHAPSSASKPGTPNDDGIRIKPLPLDDGIRIKPSPVDDGIYIRPSDDTSVTSEIQIKRTRNDGSKRRPKEENDTPTPTPRKKSEHLAPPTETDTPSRKTSYTTIAHDDDATSYMSPSPSKRKSRKSDVTDGLDDIPFGNSAFSVLDLPLGAEANTMKRPEPKRNNSFAAVPKVLKRVYNEGMKRVHDTEPSRGGPNQPPSIETWLKGTTDPFIDRPATAEPTIPVPEAPIPRMSSLKEEDRTEGGVLPEREPKQRQVSQKSEKERNSPVIPLKRADNRDTLPSMGASSPISPSGLKRTPATRAASSPKTAKKFGLKDAIFDAFKGESAMAKTAIPSPFDFIGLREGDLNSDDVESSVLSDLEDVPRYVSPKMNLQAQDKSSSENVESKHRPVPVYSNRPPPVAGGPSLSTIASVTSYSNSSSASSATGTGSELSRTTITQGTVLSGTTASSLSRGSKKSVSRKESQTGQTNTNLKRRLTKNSDLVSMLSLPDNAQLGRAKSIRSVRSIRKKKIPLEDATIEDLLSEVSQDEAKFMRELNTLVDGVIPVLLTAVLSKSDSAIAAGLFEPLSEPLANPAAAKTILTKPIVDMGVALERLRSLHRRISLTDPDSFLHWTEQALPVYEAYLRSWRSGFEDLVVNLAPASRKTSLSGEQEDSLPVNNNGDIIKDTGEVVDVAHLLKAPMRRLKLLNRPAEGIHMKRPTKSAKDVLEAIQRTEAYRRQRVREEIARKEDLKANLTDTTRARDPKTLKLVDGITIDRSFQVSMKDTFQFDLYHSTGQRMECEVELTFRESIVKKTSVKLPGDVLISQIEDSKASLLFPPVSETNISARKGDNDKELVIMIRGGDNTSSTAWKEMFVLEAADGEVRDDWLDILPNSPYPGLVIRKTMALDPEVSSLISAPGANLRSIAGTLKGKIPTDVPVGERCRRQYDEPNEVYEGREHSGVRSGSPETYTERSRGPMTTILDRIGEDAISELSDDHTYPLKDLNDYMSRLGHKKVRPIQPVIQRPEERPKNTKFALRCVDEDMFMSPADGSIDDYDSATFDDPRTKGLPNYNPSAEVDDMTRDSKGIFGSIKLPKLRSPKADMNTPLKETMRPDPHSISKTRPVSPRDDSPPPPPAHTIPITPPSMKNIPTIDTITPKVKNRRGSSPLKHEYQPSAASASAEVSPEEFTSSEEYDDSDEETTDDFDEDQHDEDEQDEMEDNLRSLPSQSAIHGGSADHITPLDSASQVQKPASKRLEFHCAVSYWNTNKWVDVHDEWCLVIVGDGWIDTYELDNPHSARDHYDASTSAVSLVTPDEAIKNPLVSQDLTPIINIRQSNSIDTQIRSKFNDHSRMRGAGYIQYRIRNQEDAGPFYAAVTSARYSNQKYRALSQQRMINQSGDSPIPRSTRSSWFSRKRSFRRGSVSDANESVPPSEESTFSPLSRFKGSRLFNIGRSSVSRAPGTAGSSSSGFSSISPPDTPLGGSQSPGSMQSSGIAVRNLGNRNLPIILYFRVGHQWANRGPGFLTVSEPAPGQLQASSLYSGPKKHVRVCVGVPDGKAVIDEVLGADSFNLGGNTGIYVEIWRDIVDERGVVGVVPSRGGVGGRTEKWCFQSRRQGDRDWIFTLLKSVVGFEER